MDRLLLASGKIDSIKELSWQQHEDLRITGNVYRKVARKYCPEKKLDDQLEMIAPFFIFIYKRGKQVRMATEDDLFDYFAWLFKKGCSTKALSTSAVCIVDFFHVLLQEGTVQHNPLFKIYNILLEGDKIFTRSKKESMLHKFVFDSEQPQDRPAPHQTEIHPSTKLPSPFHPTPKLPSRAIHSYPTWKKTNHNKMWFLAVGVLLAFGLAYLLLNDLSEHQVVTDSAIGFEGNQNAEKNQKDSSFVISPMDLPKKEHNKKTKNILEFFYRKNMQDYYCRDYLRTPCNPTNLLVNPLSANQENIHEGGMNHLKFCARCHGDTGRGNGPDAIHLDIPLEKLGWVGHEILDKDAYLFWIIAEGGKSFGGAMPPFKGILKKNEIWKVILFLETLR